MTKPEFKPKNNMLKIYLARHGQDQDNAMGILNGHRDNPLTDLGISQAHAVADKAKEKNLTFDVIYSSPLQRTFQTASIIGETLRIDNIIKLDELIERDFGVMTGQAVPDIERMCAPDIIKTEKTTYFLSPDGAETFPDLINRGKSLLNSIQVKHEDGSILLVTHGDIGKMIYAAYYNLDWKEILTMFHFGNSELLILSSDTSANEAHVIEIEQYN